MSGVHVMTLLFSQYAKQNNLQATSPTLPHCTSNLTGLVCCFCSLKNSIQEALKRNKERLTSTGYYEPRYDATFTRGQHWLAKK